MQQRRRGPRIGVRQRGNPPQYDVNSGETWRPNPTLEPDNAVRLFEAMAALKTSAAAVVNGLLAHIEIDQIDDGTKVPVFVAGDVRLPLWSTTDAQGILIDLPTAPRHAA